jgi:8-oxo-dGTP pyrophosphatase MutT (NUDIX family)
MENERRQSSGQWETREKIGDAWHVRYASAGGVVVRGDQVLLVRKKLMPEIRLPKGHIEPGESRAAAALREVAEETGYTRLRIIADLGRLENSFRKPDGVFVTRDESFFLMELEDETRSPQPPADKARFEIMWVPLEEAERLLTFEAEREFLRRARRTLANM